MILIKLEKALLWIRFTTIWIHILLSFIISIAVLMKNFNLRYACAIFTAQYKYTFKQLIKYELVFRQNKYIAFLSLFNFIFSTNKKQILTWILKCIKMVDIFFYPISYWLTKFTIHRMYQSRSIQLKEKTKHKQ